MAMAVVIIIDDDSDLRDALDQLFRSVGFETRRFASGLDFLNSPLPDAPACVVLDVRLPGISGLEFQEMLAKQERPLSVVMMTGHGDIPMSVRAMKAGAVDFLAKPFRDQEMIDAVGKAIEQDRSRRDEKVQSDEIRQCYNSLSPREREVLTQVVGGRMNKEIALELGLSQVTVKIHRASMMKKMAARTLPDLIKRARRIGTATNC